MSFWLERSIDTRGFGMRGFGTLVAATLVAVALAAVVMFTVFPAAAAAQAENTSDPSVVVVRPGDSLWSISTQRLGSEATPRRILEGVEQTYALNRGRIGADPSLIFVGQELLLPPALTQRPEERQIERPAAHEETADGGVSPRDRAAKGTAGEVPRTVPSPADAKGANSFATVAQRGLEPASLPEEAEITPVPAVGEVASSDAQPWSPGASLLKTLRAELASAASALTEAFLTASADGRAEGRRLLGLGILALTLVVAALMAWKLPMRRTTRTDTARWGMLAWYHYHYGYYGQTPASGVNPFAYHPGSLGGPSEERDEQARRAPLGALGRRRRAAPEGETDSFAASAVRKGGTAGGRQRTPKAKAVPRNGLALAAHHPKVRRAPLRAQAILRARKLRPRGGTAGRPMHHSPADQLGRQAPVTGVRDEGWEPGTSLKSTLEGLPLKPETDPGERLEQLKPHLEEALGTLTRLEQQRSLSDRERARAEAFRRLLGSIERAE